MPTGCVHAGAGSGGAGETMAMNRIPDVPIVGNTRYVHVNLKDGRWLMREVPGEQLRDHLASLFSAGIPVSYNDKITTWIPPTELRSVVVCEDHASYEWYFGSSKATREVIDRGFLK
jgi:hypothetical protein